MTIVEVNDKYNFCRYLCVNKGIIKNVLASNQAFTYRFSKTNRHFTIVMFVDAA